MPLKSGCPKQRDWIKGSRKEQTAKLSQNLHKCVLRPKTLHGKNEGKKTLENAHCTCFQSQIIILPFAICFLLKINNILHQLLMISPNYTHK